MHAVDVIGRIPANDGRRSCTPRHTIDVNSLVSAVVSKVLARAQRKVVMDVVLSHRRPQVSADAGAMAFALAGVLAAQLQGFEDAESGLVKIVVDANPRTVRVAVLSEALPLLRFVRATETGPRGRLNRPDPTMAHCRRLIERQGGTLELAEQGGLIGFCIELPALPRHNAIGRATSLPSRGIEFIDARGLPLLALAA